ncbi:BrnT family toxin [Sphingobium sp. DEHP117]|uniref:BrnT family toxin n=1 Tax=Sphingobium sp. DEHP117 TaxID=2993436 RepID=UPI0027D5C06E|nr:BrnT family toxin [Sphingobium sp. DEHP117]MDQ4421284.1 BrnT family toxin [Sphingobium sp. DEHP117]
MEIEFDADKDAINRFKHKLPLSFGRRVFDDPYHALLPSFRPQDGEDRYKAIGKVDGKLYTLVFVWRGERRRMISLRRSNAHEQREYDSHSG